MTDEAAILSERISSSHSKLIAVANDLNLVSDELGKSIAQIDEGLRRLNLGVSSWVKIYESGRARDPDDQSYWSEQVGYSKVSGRWCVCIRRVDGDYRNPDDESEMLWVFNDASRSLRLAAIDKIPQLLEKLSEEAAKTTKNIQNKLGTVQAVAAVINPSKVGFTVKRVAQTTPSRDVQNPSREAGQPGPISRALRDSGGPYVDVIGYALHQQQEISAARDRSYGEAGLSGPVTKALRGVRQSLASAPEVKK